MIVVGEGQVVSAFHAALASVEGVPKGEEADMGKYQVRYASLNAVHAECKRACQLHKLAIVQEPTVNENGQFAVATSLIHDDGSILHFAPMCLPLPKEAQALGSATTYLRRYSLVSLFGIPVEDDDGRAATVAAQTAPGRRTEAERIIREEMAQMHDDVRAAFVNDFKTEFRTSLTDLPASQHGRALTWTREWIHQPAPEPEGSVTEPTPGG
jgi:hypothetical protein